MNKKIINKLFDKKIDKICLSIGCYGVMYEMEKQNASLLAWVCFSSLIIGYLIYQDCKKKKKQRRKL